MNSREAVFGKVRSALGRSQGQGPGEVPPVRFSPTRPADELVELFVQKLTSLGVKPHVVDEREAAQLVDGILAGRSVIASNALHLHTIGVTALPGVRSGVTDKAELRVLCASCDVGITSATYCLADTGSLVLLSTEEEARMISLLPPAHVAVIPRNRILSGLDELLEIMPAPADRTSSMLLITGTSKTGDIEQILVRGVHGPGEVHVVVT